MNQQEQLSIIAQSSQYFSIQFDIYSGFLTNTIFKTPIQKTSLKTLSNLSTRFKNLIGQYYNKPEVQQLVDLFSQSNTMLVEYVYYLMNDYPQQAQSKINLMKENCEKGAKLLNRISSYWRELECKGLLITYLDLIQKLSVILTQAVDESQQQQLSVVYDSFNRITYDMAAYFSGGIISDKAGVIQ